MYKSYLKLKINVEVESIFVCSINSNTLIDFMWGKVHLRVHIVPYDILYQLCMTYTKNWISPPFLTTNDLK